MNQTAEAAYLSLELNSPLGGLYNVTNGIQFGGNDPNYFVSVQALFITPDDTLLVRDAGVPKSTDLKLRACHMQHPADQNLSLSICPTTQSHERTPCLPVRINPIPT